jgi:hypothetical protein
VKPGRPAAGNNEEETDMLAPFDPDPECPFCSGVGYRRSVGAGFDTVGRCECTNWSAYAELRRTKGLTMRQAMEEVDEAAKRTRH